MNENEPVRLNDIQTNWAHVRLALLGDTREASDAQAQLFQRYGGAIRRYLQAALGDSAAVDDLLQEFALAMVSGGFQGVQPGRGRFRDYVKGVLFRMVRKHRRGMQRRPGELRSEIDLTDPDGSPVACEEQFRLSWREALLARTWESLAESESTYFTVLHFRAAHPEMRSQQMLEELAPQLGKPLTAQGVRQTLRRARQRFLELLRDHVAGALESPTPSAIDEELCDLGLASFVLAPKQDT